MSLDFFGTDYAQVFHFPSCPNVCNTHGSVGNMQREIFACRPAGRFRIFNIARTRGGLALGRPRLRQQGQGQGQGQGGARLPGYVLHQQQGQGQGGARLPEYVLRHQGQGREAAPPWVRATSAGARSRRPPWVRAGKRGVSVLRGLPRTAATEVAA